MLKLKRVELQGFKSFCDRTEMRFNGSGIAAVVGPNGCGKSNLSDAISWVLGEQSAKTLRGSRMEDVIFAGARDRKPLSMAQVTMTLVDPGADGDSSLQIIQGAADLAASNGHGKNGHGSNGHGSLPGRPREITITRRLYRSGESEYLIDGKLARLRDIQETFMGTGLGPDSYAIIEQGRIGQLLSSRPHDRRAVIEEAAGVSKFKTRRRLAEAKLESAKQNLSRVFDILEEVGRQVATLKRQAAKAKRYQELHAELEVELRRALVGRYRLEERAAAKVALDLNQATHKLEHLRADTAAEDQRQRELLEQSYQIEAELTAARGLLADRRLEAERIRGKIESQSREIAGMESRLQQGEADGANLDEQHAQVVAEIEAHSARLAEIERQAAEAEARLAAKTSERDALLEAQRERERAIEAGRQAVLKVLGEVATLRNQLAQLDTFLAALDRDKARIEKEQQQVAADRAGLDATRRQVSAALESRRAELETVTGDRRDAEEQLNERRSSVAQLRADREQMHKELSQLRARKESLGEILSHRAYTAESVKRLFSAIEHGQAQELKPLGVLADFVEVDPAYEKAAEEFLHDELEYVIVNNWGQAEVGINLMHAGLDGRATFLVHPEPGDPMASAPTTEPPLGPETGIVARLSDVLRLTNGLTQAPATLLPRLARCLIAEDRAAAQRLALQYPDCYFLVSDGVCYHGHAVSGGRKTGAGPLALKRELRDLVSRVAQRERELAGVESRLAACEEEVQRLTLLVEDLRNRQQERQREALALDHELRRLAEEMARADSRLSVCRLELERLAEEARSSRTRQEDDLAALEDKELVRERHEEALLVARERLQEIQVEAARVAEEHSQLRAEMAGRQERRRAEQAAQARLAAQAAELARRRQETIALIERLGVERQQLLNDNMTLDERAGALTAEIRAVEEKVETLAAREAAHRDQLAAADERLRAMRESLQACQERRGQIEVDLVQRRAGLRYLDETAQKELRAPLGELAEGDETVLDEFALAEVEEKCQALKARIENLGPVNPDALQEHEEAQERYQFLNTQRQDLLDSIRDTEKAIHEIDTESRRRFSEAFSSINEYFKETFAKLFGGGSAEMRLTDETNVAESGVDIVASPPGKRLQNVLLLSGGEKALTALALLMAIFRYTPSPFCVLDEVDAPLDEPNIQRLMGLLREMSRQTQFIIITHAKRTMEVANSLYGVTMQEPGVSKLVSVRFQPQPAQAEPAFAAAGA